jgi:hypothetical protein
MPNRRFGPIRTSNGDDGLAPMPKMLRTPVSTDPRPSAASTGELRMFSIAVETASIGCADSSAIASPRSSCGVGSSSGVHGSGGRRSGASGERS